MMIPLSPTIYLPTFALTLVACGTPAGGSGNESRGDSHGTEDSTDEGGSSETAVDPSTDASGSSTAGSSTHDAQTTSGSTSSTGRVSESLGSMTAEPDPSTTSGDTADTGCGGPWPSMDPAAAGPFEVITETEVGPEAGVVEDGQSPTRFTLFRPAELGQDGRCHPVVTWGNGTGSTPNLYGVFLRHLASHGFVVIASDNENVAMGDPPPMIVGVNWVLEQNDDPESALYGRIDVDRIGATGHSQGGFATTTAGADGRMTTIAPLCGASGGRDLHGPAMLFCGGEDDAVPCSSIERSFDAITEHPVMLANYLTADHANWITFRGAELSPVEAAVTAWMRLHLMDDEPLRSWFYGASCELCTDSAWSVTQKMMD